MILGNGETAARPMPAPPSPTPDDVVTIESLGVDVPLAGAPASEFTLQAWCGMMSGCGTAATPPLQMGIAHGQWATGAVAAMAALAADRSRGRTGRGRRSRSARSR